MDQNLQLVYIWIGDNFPKNLLINLQQNRIKGFTKILITEKKVGKLNFDGIQIYLEDFYVENNFFKIHKLHKEMKRRRGFWINTRQRFDILYQYMKVKNICSLFHAELDNVIFNIEHLKIKLDKIGSGFYCPIDSSERAVASLVYINDVVSLEVLIKAIIRYPDLNDMIIIGKLVNKHNMFHGLPTENLIANNKNLKNIINIENIGGVFDAAALGQYLFGIDPRNQSGKLINGYLNEYASENIKNYKFKLVNHKGYLDLNISYEDENYKIYNLHIHSKLFHIFYNYKYNNTIISRLNDGKTSVLSLNVINTFKITLIKFIIKLKNKIN